MKNNPYLHIAIAFVVAHLGSEKLFANFGFEYNLFLDPFDIIKLGIDTGVFAVLWVSTYLVLQKLIKQ